MCTCVSAGARSVSHTHLRMDEGANSREMWPCLLGLVEKFTYKKSVSNPPYSHKLPLLYLLARIRVLNQINGTVLDLTP